MILSYSFFQHALIGSFLACMLCAMVGTYVVTRRMVIVGGGMAHASLGGVGIGAYFGFSPLAGAAGFALLSGLGIEVLSRQRRVREDSAIALLWTLGMSVGILFAYLTPGFMTDLPSYLFGDVLSITKADMLMTGALTLGTALFFICCLPVIVAIAYDRDFAITQGLPVRTFETVMTTLTALTIVSCLHMVGIVMVISLLSIPQMTAALFVKTFRGMIFLSAFFGYLGCLGGLTLSYFANVPGGASIILVSIALYFSSRIIKNVFRRLFIK